MGWRARPGLACGSRGDSWEPLPLWGLCPNIYLDVSNSTYKRQNKTSQVEVMRILNGLNSCLRHQILHLGLGGQKRMRGYNTPDFILVCLHRKITAGLHLVLSALLHS